MPTFMAQRESSMENCLNVNIGIMQKRHAVERAVGISLGPDLFLLEGDHLAIHHGGHLFGKDHHVVEHLGS